ncbi:hypothetical protein AB0K11_03955 [Mycobacterium sp. NPDC050551]|uniref:hypothetical protein n=1 Tax=Mycobacterium sp. NPDC050551 TaxID=3155407 RepID=UPI003427ED4E
MDGNNSAMVTADGSARSIVPLRLPSLLCTETRRIESDTASPPVNVGDVTVTDGAGAGAREILAWGWNAFDAVAV